jgi:hypothetical protein
MWAPKTALPADAHPASAPLEPPLELAVPLDPLAPLLPLPLLVPLLPSLAEPPLLPEPLELLDAVASRPPELELADPPDDDPLPPLEPTAAPSTPPSIPVMSVIPTTDAQAVSVNPTRARPPGPRPVPARPGFI